MIAPDWRRIAGFRVADDGKIGVAWLALDPVTSVVHCYDAAVLRDEVFAVIAEAIGARGRNVPIAYGKKDKAFADRLRESGLNTIPEPCDEDHSLAEVLSRDLEQRMRASQFRVDKRVGEWLNEFRKYYQDDGKLPKTGFPLMAATRHAIEKLSWARAERLPGVKRRNAPRLAII